MRQSKNYRYVGYVSAAEVAGVIRLFPKVEWVIVLGSRKNLCIFYGGLRESTAIICKFDL